MWVDALQAQLAAVVATMMVFTMGLRVLLGIGFVGGSLMLIMRGTMPDSIGDYSRGFRSISNICKIDHSYLGNVMSRSKAFWRLLFQGREAGDTSLLVMH